MEFIDDEGFLALVDDVDQRGEHHQAPLPVLDVDFDDALEHTVDDDVEVFGGAVEGVADAGDDRLLLGLRGLLQLGEELVDFAPLEILV